MKVHRTGWRGYALAAACVAAATGLAACSGSGSSASGSSTGGTTAAASNFTLSIATDAEATTLDPPNFSTTEDIMRINLLYSTLVTHTNNGTIEPSLATSWKEVTPTEYTLTLRHGVKFTDGTALDAAAVKASLLRAAKQPQGEALLGEITSITTSGDYQVTLHLSAPFSGILNNLSTPAAGIVGPKGLANPKSLATDPDGTGPYELKSWTQNQEMILVRNPGYWGPAPKPAQIDIYPIPEASTRMSALQSGQVDIVEDPPPSDLSMIQSSGTLKAIIEPEAQPVFIGFNLKTVPNVKVREAIAMAIDKSAIVKNILDGVGTPATNGLIAPQMVQLPSTPINIPYNPTEAAKLIAQAGAKGTTLTMVAPANYYLNDTEVEEVIKNELTQIGLNINLEQQEPATWYTTLLDHQDQIYYLGWGNSVGDPADTLTRLFESGEVNNMSGYSGSDALIKELADLPVGSAERNTVINEIQEALVVQNVVVVPIYQSVNFYAARSDVNGFSIVQSELWNLEDVTIGG